MCELLVVMANIPDHPDPAVDAMRFKRGHIATMMPDGYQWGAGDLDTNLFRIVKLPGVDPSQVQYCASYFINGTTHLPDAAHYRYVRLWRHPAPDTLPAVGQLADLAGFVQLTPQPIVQGL